MSLFKCLFSPGRCRRMASALASLLVVATVHAQTCAIPGRDGTAPASGTVNTYFQPNTGSYTAASTSISLSGKTGAATALAPGDLVLVIQMQCASLTTSNDANYGGNNGTGRGYTEPGTCQAGRHQYVRAGAASSDTSLDLAGSPLAGTYIQEASTATNRKTFQVIRVPQHASVTLSGNITAPYWNGATGGVVALDVAGQLNWGGQTIDVNGRGFRGGGSINWGGTEDTSTTPDFRRTVANNEHATKGEGIGGTPRYTFNPQTNTRTDNGGAWGGYANGDDARGAPANAGGGGDNRNGTRDNGGGGGGGNGGIGGYGGYGWKSAGWGGTFTTADFDMRGIGGAAFAAASTSRVVMGGGGGAGGTNNSGDPSAFGGGAGGGMVLIRAGSMTGNGTINANGLAGTTNTNNDGASGGGAGGSVIVISQAGGVGTLSINANGGVGADSFTGGTPAHAGGGGGAGGVVLRSGGSAPSINGGANGVTNNGGNPVLGTAHGATPGGNGSDTVTSDDPPGLWSGARCLPNLTVSKITLTPGVSASGATSASYTIVISNSGGAAIGADIVDNTLPPGWTFSRTSAITFSPALSAATYGGFVEGATPGLPAVASSPGGTANFTVNGAPAAAPLWSSLSIPAAVNGVPGVTTLSFVVSIPATATVGCYQNPAGIKYLDPTRSTAGREVTPLGNNTANRAGAQVGGTANTSHETPPGASSTVGGSNFSGLEAGPATEDVCLNGDLSVTKSAPVSGTGGATLSYTITPRNNGRGIASLSYGTHQATAQTGTGTLAFNTLRVIDTLPAGVTITAGPSPVNWSCSTLGQTVTCDRPAPVAPIAATTDLGAITLTVRVTSAACAGPVTNTATVSGFNAPLADTLPANNTATAATTLNCSANLQVTKTNNVTTLTTGSTTSYTVTFSNLGPSSADNATVTDLPSPGLSACTVASCSASGGTPAASCPATPANLLTPGGTTLPGFPSGGVVQFIVNCNVTATGT
jgi:uncharacterized repeat protein (TIGR01451 family)